MLMEMNVTKIDRSHKYSFSIAKLIFEFGEAQQPSGKSKLQGSRDRGKAQEGPFIPHWLRGGNLSHLYARPHISLVSKLTGF